MTDEVFTLLVQVGRSEGDGLPDGTSGAALLCYASGKDEKAAVDATVQVLRQADMAPIEVESYGSRSDRLADGEEISPEDTALMDRAIDENAVIVAQVTTFDD
ncbi:MAG: hypothetical protein AAF557_27760 [Pseudomonadota bacterium]